MARFLLPWRWGSKQGSKLLLVRGLSPLSRSFTSVGCKLATVANADGAELTSCALVPFPPLLSEAYSGLLTLARGWSPRSANSVSLRSC